MIEFALILPAFLLMVVMVFDLGRAVYYSSTLHDPNPPHKCVGAIDENDKTIEGYFKELNSGGYSGPGDPVNVGTFTVVLVR